MGFEACHCCAGKANRAGSRRQETTQKVETGRLAGTVWTNESDNLAFFNGKINTIDSGEPTEVFRQFVRF
jgi:hypothetical protein